jgi:chromosome segregation ATPase
MLHLFCARFLKMVYSLIEAKHAESTAANLALSAQLENISPQLVSLESALSASRSKLKEEQALRRAAEQAQDDADQRLRALEQTLQTVRDECDAAHEELAFKENELEETRLELEVEKQQLENELQQLRQQLAAAVAMPPVSTAASTSDALRSANDTATASSANADEGYAQRLEEELELVTEQLIDTEKRLSEAEAEVREKEAQLHSLTEEKNKRQQQSSGDHAFMSEADTNELVGELSSENADLRQTEQRLRTEMASLEEELALCREENHLQTEELVALEQACQAATQALEQERAQRSQEIHSLQHDLTEAETAAKANRSEVAVLSAAIQTGQADQETLLEQVAALENALENSKKDYQSCLDELDQVHARFDEARREAERAGREAALEEARGVMRTDAQHEIQAVQETLVRLSAENQTLQQAVDDAEMKLAAAKDLQENSKTAPVEAIDSEVVKQLQSQLTRVKEDLTRKEKEMTSLTTEMGERLQTAENAVTHLETELHNAKGQLAEAEAHLIVLRREKERKEHNIPKPLSPSRTEKAETVLNGAPPLPDEENETMDAPRTPTTLRGRSSSPSSVMRLEMRLAEAERKSANLEKDYNEVLDQKRMSEVRVKRLEEDVKILQKQLFAMAGNSGEAAITTQMSRLSSLGNAERGMDLMSIDEVAGQRIESIIGSRDVKVMAEELKALDQKCNSQREYNAQLLSKMLHLQGNIQVYCRIRPMSISEIQGGARSVVEPLSETEVGCFDQRTNKWKSFAFDRVWGPDQSQTSVFQDVEPLALSVVDGFNACIFAYVGKQLPLVGLF